MKHTCCWVLSPAKPGQAAVYCGQPTNYTVVLDDDGNRVRKYNAMCGYHTAMCQGQSDEESDDD